LIIWPLKKKIKKSTANRINALASINFEFDMNEELVTEELATV